MDKGQLNYQRYTEGNRVSLGESADNGVATRYVMEQRVLKSILGYYKPPLRFIELTKQVKRLNGRDYQWFCYLIEKRIDSIKGELKFERIQKFIEDERWAKAVTEILR